MLREEAFDTGEVTLHTVWGEDDGPPLLLIHGLSGRWQAWLPIMPALALRWRLCAVDLRGHGRSGRTPNAYRIGDYARDIAALLRRRVGEPAVVMGHSLGAIIATAVAAETPTAVRAVVLEDPPLAAFRHERLAERPEYQRFLLMRDLAGSTLPPADLDAAVRGFMPTADAATRLARAASLRQLDPAVMDFVLADRAKEGYDQDAALARIAAPTLLLQGNPDLGGALRAADAEHAAGLLRRGMHVVMPAVGHGMHSDNGGDPAGFVRVFNDFIDSAEGD